MEVPEGEWLRIASSCSQASFGPAGQSSNEATSLGLMNRALQSLGMNANTRVIRREGERCKVRPIVSTHRFCHGFSYGMELIRLLSRMAQDAYVNCLSNHSIPYLKTLQEEQRRE